MDKRTRNVVVGALFLVVLIYSIADYHWPRWFPKTEIIVRNESGQEVQSIVIEAPGESITFGPLQSGDVVTKKINRRRPAAGFSPNQHGALADGTELIPVRIRGADGEAFAKLEYTILPDGTLGAHIGMATD
jgi:hypothetical protein